MRVAETLGARRLLEVDLEKTADGTHTIRYAIWKPGEAEPAWSTKSKPFADAEIAERAMRDRCNPRSTASSVSAKRTAMAWPDAATLRLAGHMLR